MFPQAPKMNNHCAVLFRFPCEQYLKGSTNWIDPICRVTNLAEFIAKQIPCQSGLFLTHEANVKTLFLEIKMMVFYAINSPFCCTNSTLWVLHFVFCLIPSHHFALGRLSWWFWTPLRSSMLPCLFSFVAWCSQSLLVWRPSQQRISTSHVLWFLFRDTMLASRTHVPGLPCESLW